jgi:uncharacterized protein YyaL (SSP411 family)
MFKQTSKTFIIAITLILTALVIQGCGKEADPEPEVKTPIDHEKIWTQNFEEAKALAKKEGKDLFVDFTGSDWCGWCIKFDNEIFKTDLYATEAPKDFVHVKLDFPRNIKIAPEIAKQNVELKKKYPIPGYPTEFLMDADGFPYAMSGYQAGGPQAYLDHLAELIKIREKRDTALQQASQLEGAEKAGKLKEAMVVMHQDIVKKYYSDIVDQIKELESAAK